MRRRNTLRHPIPKASRPQKISTADRSSKSQKTSTGKRSSITHRNFSAQRTSPAGALSPRSLAPLLAIPLISAFLLAGCGNEKQVTFKSAGMTHTFSEGGEDLPKELKPFVYPEAVVAGATNAHDSDGEQARFLSMSSTDSLEKVTGWYQKKMESDGWTIDETDKLPRMINMSGHKKDLEVNVVMAEDGTKTTISVSQGRSVDEPLSDSELDSFSPNELTPATD